MRILNQENNLLFIIKYLTKGRSWNTDAKNVWDKE